MQVISSPWGDKHNTSTSIHDNRDSNSEQPDREAGALLPQPSHRLVFMKPKTGVRIGSEIQTTMATVSNARIRHIFCCSQEFRLPTQTLNQSSKEGSRKERGLDKMGRCSTRFITSSLRNELYLPSWMTLMPLFKLEQPRLSRQNKISMQDTKQ